MITTQSLTGTCAFRLMPVDPLADGPSSALVTRVGEQGFTLHYTWVHPADGEQRGVLLVGGVGGTGSSRRRCSTRGTSSPASCS